MEEKPYKAATVMTPLVASDFSGMVYEAAALICVISLGLGFVSAAAVCLVYRKLWPLLLTPVLLRGGHSSWPSGAATLLSIGH